MRAILYTRFDGGVTVTYPTQEIFDVMSRGGYWSDRPRGFLQAQIERQIADGIDPDHARRFAYAVQFGGLSTAEVYEVIKLRDCSRHGHSFELIDPAVALPGRWFRDAWARGHNSGAVYVDMARARLIQLEKIEQAVADENARRASASKGQAHLAIERVAFDRLAIEAAIRNAADETELRRVWPEQLQRH